MIPIKNLVPLKLYILHLLDAILGNCIPYKDKPYADDVWIFALGPLVINLAMKIYGKVRVSLDKVLCLSWSNA